MASAAHLVWDWNGTLVDDWPVLLDAVGAAVRAGGYRKLGRAEIAARLTRPLPAFLAACAGVPLSAAETSALLGLFEGEYRDRRALAPLAPGAVSALRRWRDAGGTQSVLSSWNEADLERHVDELGLSAMFDAVDGRKGEAFEKAARMSRHLRRCGVERAAVTVIGDSADDVRAAAAVGAAVVLVRLRGGEGPVDGVPVVDSVLAAVNVIESGVLRAARQGPALFGRKCNWR